LTRSQFGFQRKNKERNKTPCGVYCTQILESLLGVRLAFPEIFRVVSADIAANSFCYPVCAFVL